MPDSSMNAEALSEAELDHLRQLYARCVELDEAINYDVDAASLAEEACGDAFLENEGRLLATIGARDQTISEMDDLLLARTNERDDARREIEQLKAREQHRCRTIR